MEALLLVPLALLLDYLLGEPSRFHPLVGFGKLSNWLESKANKDHFLFLRGAIAWMLAVIPITLVIYYLDQWVGGLWLGITCGWLAIGWRSLREHGLAVVKALESNNIEKTRRNTSYLVSRDTSKLDESALSKATIESLLENGSDAIFATLFWLVVFGAPGVVLYRLSNTLDAMWGYRNERFEQFGKFSARVDDVLNIIPARLSAALYLLFGNSKLAWQAWKTQGRNWYSPNAGIVMATGAGALNLSLGGNAVYNGKIKQRSKLGYGEDAKPDDIHRALKLIDYSLYGLTFFLMIIVIAKYTLSLLNDSSLASLTTASIYAVLHDISYYLGFG